jgi:hypothetical protein
MATRHISIVVAVSVFVLGATLVGVAPAEDAPPQPPLAAPYDAAKTAAERALNEAGYREHIHGWRTYYLHQHLGKWVAIAGGKAYPVNATGTAVRPVDTMEEADAAARAAVPDAHHRFVWRIGEEGPVVESMGGAEIPHVLGNVFIADLERPDVEMKGFGPNQKIYYAVPAVPAVGQRAERIEITVKGPDDRMFMKPEVGAPGTAGRAETPFVLSTGYSGCMTISAETAAAASLHLWEVPGAVTVEHVPPADGDPQGLLDRDHARGPQRDVWRRARARVRFRGTDIDLLLPVSVWPEKK